MICFDTFNRRGAKRVFDFAPFGRLVNDDWLTTAWVVETGFKYGPIGDPPNWFDDETVVRLRKSVIEYKTPANEFEIRFVGIVIRTSDG